MVSVWAFALLIGINPVLGARIGLWLQGHSFEEPAEPIPGPAPPPRKAPGQEHLGNNVDRFV